VCPVIAAALSERPDLPSSAAKMNQENRYEDITQERHERRRRARKCRREGIRYSLADLNETRVVPHLSREPEFFSRAAQAARNSALPFVRIRVHSWFRSHF
jgi:hypothetical protein